MASSLFGISLQRIMLVCIHYFGQDICFNECNDSLEVCLIEGIAIVRADL